MRDFERTVIVSAAPDEAYRFLADPGNMPGYIATMVLARPEEGNRLRVAADVEGRHEEGDARFRTNPGERLLEWGAEDDSHYYGWMRVSPDGNGSSVTIHLHVARDEDEAEVNRVMDETGQNIQRLLGSI
jgi:uncharacterized protein YndB with AHSA1/START domain